MDKLKIKFSDFWFGFLPDKNYFFKLLSQTYELVLSDDPDILIYSSYGLEYLKYNCTRVFFTAENMRPDFTGCDYALTFDYNTDSRHFRLPLYALYIDQAGSLEKLLERKTAKQAIEIWRSKTKFCCMVVSNGQSQKRLNFFHELSKYKPVDSGGSVLNNVGGPVKDKMQFIKDYRFVIAFENASHPGYTTEKIIEPLLVNSISLYWGNPLIYHDFNKGCFLNLEPGKSEQQFIQEIIEIDRDEEKAAKILMEPTFASGIVPSEIEKENLARFFEKIINNAADKIPISRTSKRYLHIYKIRKTQYANRVKRLVNRFI